MKMKPEVLTRLLAGGHLNVEQRKALGLWPAEKLDYSEVLDHLANLLEKVEWFPDKPGKVEPGRAVCEGIWVCRKGRREYACLARCHRADSPYVLAEEKRTLFSTSRQAAEYYLKWQLNLPGRLDGWPVVK